MGHSTTAIADDRDALKALGLTEARAAELLDKSRQAVSFGLKQLGER